MGFVSGANEFFVKMATHCVSPWRPIVTETNNSTSFEVPDLINMSCWIRLAILESTRCWM